MISVQCCCELTSDKQQRERDAIVENIKTFELPVFFIFHKKTNKTRINCFAVWTDYVIVSRFGVGTTPASTLFCPLSDFLTECD